MAYELKDNSGSLFKNDRKQKETHPDYKGQPRVFGREFWLSAWIKTSQNGDKWMSLSVQEKNADTPDTRKSSRETTPEGGEDKKAVDDDSIPF